MLGGVILGGFGSIVRERSDSDVLHVKNVYEINLVLNKIFVQLERANGRFGMEYFELIPGGFDTGSFVGFVDRLLTPIDELPEYLMVLQKLFEVWEFLEFDMWIIRSDFRPFTAFAALCAAHANLVRWESPSDGVEEFSIALDSIFLGEDLQLDSQFEEGVRMMVGEMRSQMVPFMQKLARKSSTMDEAEWELWNLFARQCALKAKFQCYDATIVMAEFNLLNGADPPRL